MPVLTTIQTAYKWLHSAHWRCRGRWNSGTGHCETDSYAE